MYEFFLKMGKTEMFEDNILSLKLNCEGNKVINQNKLKETRDFLRLVTLWE